MNLLNLLYPLIIVIMYNWDTFFSSTLLATLSSSEISGKPAPWCSIRGGQFGGGNKRPRKCLRALT